MIISGEDFQIELNKGGTFFDLSMLTIVNEGKSNERSEFKPCAYGLTILGCIKYIVHSRFLKEEVELSLPEFILRYREEINKIKEFINNFKEDDNN